MGKGPSVFFNAERSALGRWMPVSVAAFGATRSTGAVPAPAIVSANTEILPPDCSAGGSMPFTEIVLPLTTTAGSTPSPDAEYRVAGAAPRPPRPPRPPPAVPAIVQTTVALAASA